MLAMPAVRQAARACSTNSTGVGPLSRADEDGGVVGVEDELALVRALLADAEEVGDRRAAVRPLQPLVVGPELELRGRRHLLDGVEGGEERRGVDAVAVCGGLAVMDMVVPSFWWWWCRSCRRVLG